HCPEGRCHERCLDPTTLPYSRIYIHNFMRTQLIIRWVHIHAYFSSRTSIFARPSTPPPLETSHALSLGSSPTRTLKTFFPAAVVATGETCSTVKCTGRSG